MPILTKLIHPWTLPNERDFAWKMKTLESAKTNFSIDKDGVYILTIEHDLIRGVTPQMLLWWFQNIGGEMEYQGKVYPKYLVWHPKDHIHWSLQNQAAGKPIGAGSYFRIVEALDRNMNYLIDSTEYVEKLDETGIRLVRTIGGKTIFSLQHDFKQIGNNTFYYSTMKVGASNTIGRIFNSCLRPLIFTKEMGYAWLKHNIEEVGNFEFFLPELYHKETGK